MTLINSRDYVFSPQSNLIFNGVNFCAILGTKNHFFLIPIEQVAGAGRSFTTTKTTIGNQPVVFAVQTFLADESQDVQKLETWLKKIILDDLRLNPDVFILPIQKLSEFEIKLGLLSKGIYFKKDPGDRRQTIVGIPKDIIQEFKTFYGR